MNIKQVILTLSMVCVSNVYAAISLTVPQDFISDFPNEKFSLQTQKVTMEYDDVVIPGDAGLDIIVTRVQEGDKVKFSTTTLTTQLAYHEEDELFNQSCIGSFQKLIIVQNGRTKRSIGFDNTTKIPSEAIVTFDDNSYFYCDGNIPKLRFPNGRVYTFAISTQIENNLYKSTLYYLRDITDRYGNTLVYEYENDVFPSSYNRPKRLKNITRNDGQIVSFVYGTIGITFQDYSPEFIKEVIYSEKKVQYKFINRKLDRFIDAEGRETKFTYSMYTGLGYQIRTVTTPEGNHIRYRYSAVYDSVSARLPNPSDKMGMDLGDYGQHGGTLNYKVITNANGEEKTFIYDKYPASSGFGYRAVTYIENYSGGKDLTIEHSVGLFGRLDGVKLFEGEFINSDRGNLYNTHALLYEKTNEWERINTGLLGCHIATFIYAEAFYCGKSEISQIKIKIKNGSMYDEFLKERSDFNSYGMPGEITETFGSNKKAITQTYEHDVSNWILNQPLITKIGTSLTSLKDIKEIIYYSKDHANYPFFPYEEKLFGVWNTKYSGYDSSGNISKIEYNEKLTFGDTEINRYKTFGDYNRGIPQTITIPKRYSSDVMTKKQIVDALGRLTSITDFNSNITSYTYDEMGRLKSTVFHKKTGEPDWLGTFISWSYDGGINNDQPVKIEKRCTLNTAKNACSNIAKMTKKTTFDYTLNPVFIEKNDGSQTIYQNMAYNTFGQLIFQSYPSYNLGEIEGTHFTYDALQRQLSQAQDNGGTIINEYLAGNQVRVTDAEKNITTTTYLAYGSPSYNQKTKIESPENVTTEIIVNIHGNIDSIKQLGTNGTTAISQTEYRAYDNQLRLCQINRNDVGATVLKRNTNGEIAWQAQGQIAASNTVCNSSATVATKVNFTYDNLGNQRTISYEDGTPTRTFTLDKNGNINAITGQGFNQEYNYNSLNLLEDETLTITGRTGNLKLDYGYDTLGNLTSLQYPDGIAKVDFLPNAFGQATQAIRTYADAATDIFVKGGTSKATYHANGSIDGFTYGNNVIHKTRLNSRQIPSQITDKFSSVDRVNLSYTYDYNNNIKSLVNTRDGGMYSLTNLTYDGLDRLKTTTGGSGIGSSNITYDGLGNILTYSNNSLFDASNLTYSYKSNFLLKDVKATSTNTKVRDFSSASSYDARGNVLKNGNENRTFDYNIANQMTSSGRNSYVYDGYNRRIKTQDSKGTSYSFYSQSGKLLYRETVEGGINYIFLGNKLVAKEGTGVSVSSDSIMNYKPFGDSIEEPKDDVGYTGHKFDTDLGLSYMQARYYDPVIGRFYSNDPVGYTAKNPVMSFNRYMYVNNNPYKYTDPDGEWLQLIGAAIGAGLEFGLQVHQKGFDKVDYSQVAVAGLAGAAGAGLGKLAVQVGKAYVSGIAATGVVADAAGATVIASAIAAEGGAVIGGSAAALNGGIDYLQGDRDTLPSTNEIYEGAAKGFVSSGIAGGVSSGGSILKIADEVTEVVGQTAGKAAEDKI